MDTSKAVEMLLDASIKLLLHLNPDECTNDQQIEINRLVGRIHGVWCEKIKLMPTAFPQRDLFGGG